MSVQGSMMISDVEHMGGIKNNDSICLFCVIQNIVFSHKKVTLKIDNNYLIVILVIIPNNPTNFFLGYKSMKKDL